MLDTRQVPREMAYMDNNPWGDLKRSEKFLNPWNNNKN